MRRKEKRERSKDELTSMIFAVLSLIFCLIVIAWTVLAVIDFGFAMLVLVVGAGVVFLIVLALACAASLAPYIAEMFDGEKE